ncbi:MAG: DUF3870 domain-containing protein [Limnochordales bacterium]
MAVPKNTVLVTGYAKAPQGTTLGNAYGYVGIVLLVDKERDTILAAEPTFVTGLAREFIQDLLVGYDIKLGEGPLRRELRARYLAPSQQALLQAIQIAFQRYRERTRAEVEAYVAGDTRTA